MWPNDPTVQAALIAAIVAVTAVISSVVATAVTLRHERQLAGDERIWQRRADAYVGYFMLADARKKNVAFPDEGLPATIGAVYAFGSLKVIELMEAIPSVREDAAGGRGATGTVAEQMRRELQSRHR